MVEFLAVSRTAHVQLKFGVETFDRHAKKHSERKRELFLQRFSRE